MAELSKYCSIKFASSDDVAGAISDGFRTTVLPAEMAPMTGSIDNTEDWKLAQITNQWKEKYIEKKPSQQLE